MKLLQFVLELDQLVNFFHEVRLRLGDNCLDLMDLLVDNLVDLLHVVEHLVRLLVEQVKLLLVAFQLDLTTVHLLTGVVLLGFLLDALQDLLLVVLALARVQVRVLVLLVVVLESGNSLLFHGAAELLDVATEGLSEHL